MEGAAKRERADAWIARKWMGTPLKNCKQTNTRTYQEGSFTSTHISVPASKDSSQVKRAGLSVLSSTAPFLPHIHTYTCVLI